MTSTLLTSTISFEVEVGVSGVLVSGYPDTHNDPGMADTMEDVEVMSVGISKLDLQNRAHNGRLVWETTDLLTGIERKSPEIQRLFANILEATGRDVEDALLQEVD